MAQKPVLRAEVGMRVCVAQAIQVRNDSVRRERGIGQIPRKIYKSEVFVQQAVAVQIYTRFGFTRVIPRNSRGKGNFYRPDVISATGI